THHLPPHTYLLSNHPATTEIYTLSLHDALPISRGGGEPRVAAEPSAHPRASGPRRTGPRSQTGPPAPSPALWTRLHRSPAGSCRSEEHTSELQSRGHLVCRLLLEKKKKKNKT